VLIAYYFAMHGSFKFLIFADDGHARRVNLPGFIVRLFPYRLLLQLFSLDEATLSSSISFVRLFSFVLLSRASLPTPPIGS
jgi:hypothetical protein